MWTFNFNQFFNIFLEILLVYLFVTALTHAAPPTTLSRLMHEAAQNNPAIKAAYHRWLSEKYMIPQSRSLPDPNVDLGYIKMSGNDPMNVSPRREQMIGLSQEIPFPGKLSVRPIFRTRRR